jgi:hypothetical protein
MAIDPMINPVRINQPPSFMPSALPPPAQKGPGRFARIFGGILGGALNLVAPGAGSILGSFIGGGGSGGVDQASMQTMLQQHQQDSMRMIAFQTQVQKQAQEFSTITNLLKVKHDGDMEAVRNFKS